MPWYKTHDRNMFQENASFLANPGVHWAVYKAKGGKREQVLVFYEGRVGSGDDGMDGRSSRK